MRTNKQRFDLLQRQYVRIRDCIAGEDAIKDQGQLYVPRPDGMSAQNYTHYLDRGAFYGVPEMTLRSLSGLALRKDPVIKLPERLEPLRLRATIENAPLSVMIEDMVREVLSMGRFGLLLDFPRDGNTALTTPHFATFVAETIEDYETDYVNGQLELTRVILASDEDFEGADVFLELCLEDTIYKIKRFVKEGQSKTRLAVGEEIIPQINGKALNYIPFLMVSHESLRPVAAKPPMQDLCTLAISHFKNSCDVEHALFLTGAPTPYCIGSIPEDKKPSTLGSGALWLLPEGSEVGLLEFTGAGVAAMKQNMESKADQMVALGARMLSASMNRNETIDTATQRTRSELSLLHSSVVMIEAALLRLLRVAADWVGTDPNDVVVTMSRDFIETSIDPKMIETQFKLWQGGMISRATFWSNLQQGEIAPADRSWEDEKDMVEEEGGDLSTVVPVFSGTG